MFADANSPMVIRATREWIERTVRREYEAMAVEVERENGRPEAVQALKDLAKRGQCTADELLSTLTGLLGWKQYDAMLVMRRIGLDRHLTPGSV